MLKNLLTNIDKHNTALYINIPFCKNICTYCHYINNIKFGYNHIPENYFKILIQDIKSVCSKIKNCNLKSIYFGGGTPSLLTDTQILQIKSILNFYKIRSEEISIELYPGRINFNYAENDLFTRYSLGVQSFDDFELKKYKREGYDIQEIRELISLLYKNKHCSSINIDLIFNDSLKIYDTVSIIEELKPNTVTFYPNTKGRGVKRLKNICCTLRSLKDAFHYYLPLLRSNFIFIKKGSKPSQYSRIENETFGDIIGIGNNSVSFLGDKSYLKKYLNNKIKIIERCKRGNRYLNSFLSSLPVGLPKRFVRKIFPNALYDHYLLSIPSEIDINSKNSTIDDDNLVYLPETEYVRFYLNHLNKLQQTAKNAFLSTIGYGDTDEKTIIDNYNTQLLMSNNELNNLSHYLTTNKSPNLKLQAPNLYMLVEGIDGSGKDTFVHFLAQQLKCRFSYGDSSSISVMGQPDSSLPYGIEAKRFIENLEYETKESVIRAIRENRAASENILHYKQGICILIRGIVTDIATFNYKFSDKKNSPSESSINWDYYIIIDVDVDIANKRIEKRGVQRTWREYPNELTYFHNFYNSYQSDIFKEKIIIKNISFETLYNTAIDLANKIYAKEFIQSIQ